MLAKSTGPRGYFLCSWKYARSLGEVFTAACGMYGSIFFTLSLIEWIAGTDIMFSFVRGRLLGFVQSFALLPRCTEFVEKIEEQQDLFPTMTRKIWLVHDSKIRMMDSC